MRESILVDTSVWIDFFNGTDTEQVATLVTYIQDDDPLILCPTIIQEVLQGITNDNQCKKIKDYLMCFNILNDDNLESALDAVKIYRRLRKKGISIQKSNDCLIAQYAFKYNLKMIHKDRDFDMIIEHYK